MATPADSRAVKSLSNSKGRNRFGYKTFSEKIDEAEFNVFRKSLDKVKDQPLEGSTFFKDCLVEWRELNTAADFIKFYEEMLPFVQTLPLIIFQKELIFSKLVSGLQIEARLSLEAFLRLIVALSRDLSNDFIPFLPQLVNSLVSLLKNGGQVEPEIIEQIFLSFRAILNELQKYLVRDIGGFLRDTLELRYYPKDYISDRFVSRSISFLLRTAGDEQLEIGIKKILSEVEDPSKKDGGVSQLYHVMKGTSMSLHSKAMKVLKFLLKDFALSFCGNFPQGSGSTVEVVSSTLRRICEDFRAEELIRMWKCLYEETKEAIINKKPTHLSRLLTVLTSSVRVEKGLKVYDYQYLVGLVSEIVSTFMDSSDTVVLDKVLELMLCTIDRPSSVNEVESIASQWSPIFSLKSLSLLTFLRELLKKDKLIVKAFTSNILSWINNLILESWEEVLPLLLSLCERQQTSHYIIDEPFESKYERIHEFLEENIKKVGTKIENIGLAQIDETEFAAVCGSVNCYPYFKVDSSLLICFKNTLKQHLAVNTFSAQELKWQSLLGATLRSCHKFCSNGRLIHSDLEEALSLAKCYKSCVQVLSPVADYLDFVYRPLLANGDSSKAACAQELQANNAEVAFDVFSENLRHSNKEVRLTTLRILCHFETLSLSPCSEEHPPKKKLKTQAIHKSFPERNVLQLLHTIEKSPITVSTQTELVSLINRIQMDLSTNRVHEAYMPLVFNGMIGIFHNRYSKICERASECLVALMNKHTGTVWNDFVRYLEHCQVNLEAVHNHNESENYTISEKSDSTPTATVVSLLLQTLQKVPTVVQSRASEILPLFLTFLGYNSENPLRVGLFNRGACKGEEWKKLLIQWLNLLKLMKNPKSSRFSLFVNDVLQNRFLDDNDAEIQTNVLQCLLLWNDYLIPHRSHLESLIKTKELREELATWNLSKDIENAQRPHLVSPVIRILMPKIRNLKNSSSRKRTSICNRKAILGFISQFDVNELSLFFALLMKPLNIISEEAMDLFSCSSLDSFKNSNLLKYFTVDTISTLSRKQKSGFLHVIEHILQVFDEFHVRPFLDFLMGCVVRLMLNYDASNTDDKSLRSLCLKIIAQVLRKYEDCDIGSEFWDRFFSAVNPLVKSFKQEGSSSEKPSSLFSCFLSMSENRNLVTLLCREESLIPDIFSFLTVTTASKEIKLYALELIENLLILDNELDEDESAINGFLDPYIESLINSLHSFFIEHVWTSVEYKGERVIKILKLVYKHIIGDESCVMKYLDILLSFLDKNVKDSGTHREALLAIQDIALFLGTESISKIINTISPLLVDAKIDVRLCICDLLESLAKIDFSLDLVAKCVSDMNAVSPMEVDELDYETIINAYGKIDADFFNKSSEQHMMIILSQSLYNISSSEELTLKDSACNLLCTFIDFSASILCQEASESSSSWTGDRVLRIIIHFVLKHIGDRVNRGKSSGKEEIRLIRKMVTKLPDSANLAAFRPLCSENRDQDFFENLFNIQAHRKAKAITSFAKVIKDNNLPEGVVRNFLVSIFFNMLLDEQNLQNVQDACKEAIASVSAHMNWESYKALLNRCFHEMRNHTKKKTLLLQLIGLILNNFHFSKDEALFPELQKLMDSDSVSDRVKLNTYVTAVKVLKLLPKEIMEPQVDSVFLKICSYLKSKEESTRDEARKALVSCLKELGMDYLQLVVKNLRAILKRGSDLHVLGFTVNTILSKCLSSPKIGELDDWLGDLLSVAKTDIFGDFDERDEKRESRYSKKMETKTCKSLGTLKLIAENVTFESHALKLLSPVTEHLHRNMTPKLKSKLEEMLKYIAAGFEANPSVEQGDLFCFVYGLLVDDGIEDQVSSSSISKKRKSRETNSCPHLITVFALDLLHNRLKRIQPNSTDKALLSKLDPFVKLLVGCLSSKYEDVVSSSIRCFTSLFSRSKLPSLISEADKVLTTVLTIIDQSPVSSRINPLVQSCLSLLDKLVSNKYLTLSSEQLKILLQCPMFDDLESYSNVESSVTCLSLIKAIVKKKVQVPEVYDIIDQVSKLMITTQEEQIRKCCKEILLQVVVYYTLSKKRLEGHFRFLLINLSYKHSNGRIAVLEVLQTLIEKFSRSDDLGKKSVLDQQTENLFLELGRRLATDDSKKVLHKIGDVIKLLVCCISKNKVDSSIERCLDLYKQEDSQPIAARLLGLFMEAKREAFPKRIRIILLEEAKKILESTVQLQDTIEEGSVPFWKEAFFSLVMIEKLLMQFPGLCFGKDLEDVWRMVFKLLSHPHEWLRTISCRFLNHYFKGLDGRKSQKLVADSLLEKPSSLFMVASSLCFQLKEFRVKRDKDKDDKTERIITENIVFAVSGLHSLIDEQSDDHDDEFWSSLDNDEQVVFLKAFEMFDSGKGRSTFLALASGKRTADDVRKVLIGSLLKRLGKIGLDTESLQMRIVFNFFKGFASKLNQEECRLYAFRILLPLYKVCQGFTGNIVSGEMKQLAEEVRDGIRDECLGPQLFVQVYRDIQKSLETKREKRKQEVKRMAVINPEGNAKRKLELASKNKTNKKRRIMFNKMERWARS